MIRELLPADASVYRDLMARGLAEHPERFRISSEDQTSEQNACTQQKDSNRLPWKSAASEMAALICDEEQTTLHLAQRRDA